jgi:hypothetical protein
MSLIKHLRRFGGSGILAAFLLACGAFTASADRNPEEPGHTELLDPELSKWVVENAPEENFSVTDDGVLRVVEPEGWLRSRATYTDFRLRAEFRFLTNNADSGIFVRASGDNTFARGWPRGSYQVQMLNPKAEEWPFPPLGAVFRHGMPAGETRYDAEDARRLSRETGEWQILEIKVAGEELTVWLNEELLTEAAGIGAPGHYIGIQGETGAVEFRSLAIQELPSE